MGFRKPLVAAASVLGLAVASHGAMASAAAATIDESTTATLTGDLSTGVLLGKDQGPVAESTPLSHIRLVLKRPPALQASLDKLVHDQQVKGSPVYHQWLKPADLASFRPAAADIAKVTAWLTSQGLTVNYVSPSGLEVNFGGRAGDVARAFHTSLHNLVLNGKPHIANVTAPVIPAALSSVIAGVTLHNFFPVPMMHAVTPQYTSTGSNGTFYAVAPPDFATIYNVTPLRGTSNKFNRVVAGAGITIAVIEQTDIKSADWQTFRSSFGLSGYSGTLLATHPHCQDPGSTGDEGEAALDAEWSGAVAPDAIIEEASCASVSPFDFGVESALTNLIEYGTTATVFSISYGGDELLNGVGFTTLWSDTVEEAAAEGISVFVSTGDSGASVDGGGIDSQGLFVNALSDSVYSTAVGGTDFLDTAEGQNSTYWTGSNSTTGGSAISYIPETTWNNSCASSLVDSFEGYANPITFCNVDPAFGQPSVGGSGGQSVYFAKPSWQLTSIPGMPNDGKRDQPDVSLFAANGLWGHFLLLCMSDKKEGGTACDYSNQNDLLGNAAGGTSFAAPAFAGIAALVEEGQSISAGTKVKLGNMAPELYQLAQTAFSVPATLKDCNASLGTKTDPSCVFHNVTNGNIAEPCNAGTASCFAPKSIATSGVGVLLNPSISTSKPAYTTGPGYSLATGLGSVNVTNLVDSY
jgi:subtilase family serine protease